MRKLLLIPFFSLFLIACGGGDSDSESDDGGEQSNTSHNAGENCMACHIEGGDAIEFGVAGTVYQSGGSVQTNATVNLFVAGTNTLAATLDTDDSGNFYQTERLAELFYPGDSGTVVGIDVEVVGPGGARNMPGVVSTGACGSCHGDSVGNIVAN